MKAIKIFDKLIDKVNNDPLNSNKFYFEYILRLSGEKTVSIELIFGTNPENMVVFKEINRDNDVELTKEKLFTKVLKAILENSYDLHGCKN